MPSDNRERSFENALAAHLRADAGINSRPDCADAETLAAYHDGSLTQQQVAALKSHSTACQHCREILTTLEATDQIALPSPDLREATSAPATPLVHVLPVRPKTPLWQWLTPAGALAAALLVWVAVRENPPSITLKNPASAAMHEEAERQSQAPPRISPTPPSQTVHPPGIRSTAPGQASLDATRGLAAKPQPKISTLSPRIVPKEKDSLDSAKSDLPAGFDQSSDNSIRREDALPRSKPPAPDRYVASQMAEVAPGTPEKKENLSKSARDSALAAPPKPAFEANSAPSPAPSAPSPLALPQASTESAAVSGGALQQQEMAGRSRSNQNPELRLANSLAEVTISAPDSHVSWRVGQAGIIEFSSDSGKSWALQPSGVITDLLAGSAISGKLCWIVGRAGTILRTTDAGAHWKKLTAPTQDDLRSIFAVDAQQAVVSSVKAKFQTLDGGITWKKMPPE